MGLAGESVKVAVIAATPGADSSVYVMFNSVVTFQAGGMLRPRGVSRVTFSVENSQAGTLKAYRSVDKGTNWDQVGGDVVVGIASAKDISGPYDYLVDTYSDFKLEWTNGGAAQATWRPEVTMIVGDRASGT
jgi:hypothetical protein